MQPIPPTLSTTDVFASLFAEHHGWLRARLRRVLGDVFTAEDIASESFTQLLSNAQPALIREPKALLTTISQRLVYDLWRRRDLEQACLQALALRDGDQYQSSPEEEMLLLEALRAMDRALASLSKRECAAFLLYKLDGLSYADIGQQLDVPATVARRYVAKGLLQCYNACNYAPLG
jgi:RNA polymerase sigma factor (sigma-70 family)